MPEPVRLFFAVPLDDDTRAAVVEARDCLRSVEPGAGTPAAARGPIKWVEDENLHVTLKFVGPATADLVPRLERVAAEVAGRHAAFEMVLQGAGAFPDAGTPRVIWLGATTGSQPLTALASDLDEALAKAALVAKEDRPFATHLTLGRVKVPTRMPRLQAAIEGGRNDEVARMRCNHFVLMRSELSRKGPTYTKLERFDLREDG